MGGLLVLAAEGGRTAREVDGPGWGFFVAMFAFWGLWVVVVLACYVFGIWALVETIRYRDDEFDAVGSSRVLWLVLTIVGLTACQPVGAVAGPLFLLRVRPRLRGWREAHPLPPPWAVPHGYGASWPQPVPGLPSPPGPSGPAGYPPPGWGPPAHPSTPYPPPPPPVPEPGDGPSDGGR